ncbi:MAG TPA: hypothetical protein VM096_05640, partial [Vicinamibacterales bacterium]|nr:hypothetical protein [Vicinamibacterales bacterium]
REDDDLRGRAPGAVAEMIRGALASERPALPIETVLNELAAIDTAIADLRPGAAVLLFVDDIAAAQTHLLEQGAVPDTAFRPSARRPHDAAKPAA